MESYGKARVSEVVRALGVSFAGTGGDVDHAALRGTESGQGLEERALGGSLDGPPASVEFEYHGVGRADLEMVLVLGVVAESTSAYRDAVATARNFVQ